MLPVTLLSSFATQTTLTAAYNSGGFIPSVDCDLLMVMKACTCACWALWIASLASVLKAKKA